MITVDNLIYEYPGKRALSDVTFHIPPGSITALVGPNGAGKTTLLRCIAALDEPFSGSIRVADIDVAEQPRRVHQELGYLSDFFGLYDDLTVRQCLLYSASLHQLPQEKAEEQLRWAVALLELGPWLDKKAGTLSRGWRQRLGIAQAVIHRPRLLLLDEPASGLDPEARITLSKLFRQLRDEGMTIIVSSHILAELEDYCTEMLVLREGRVVEHRNAVAGEEKHSIEITFLEAAQGYLSVLEAEKAASVVTLDQRTIRLQFAGSEADRAALLKSLLDKGAKISAFSIQKRSLQDVYMALKQEGKA